MFKSCFPFRLRSLLRPLFNLAVLHDWPQLSSQPIFAVSIINIRVIVQLKLSQLVQLHLIFHILRQLLLHLLCVQAGILMSNRIPRNLKIRQNPIVQLVTPAYLLIYHFDVLSGYKVINYEIFKFKLFLKNPSSLLQSLYFLAIHLLQLFVLIGQNLKSLHFLFYL